GYRQIMTLTLRKAADADYPSIISWVPDLATAQLWGGPMMAFPLTVEELKSIIKPDEVHTFVMVHETDIVLGTAQFYFAEPSRFHLARIMVKPDERGKGYGRKLVNLLMGQTWDVPNKYFTLNVNFGNDKARALYESLGFAIAEPEQGSFSKTAHFMRKNLVDQLEGAKL
ncbi:MAG: GNAT family N-acetyltransferase, partial [Chloroflexota bacterium]